MTTINILHLYPKEMNLYGDHGNVVALQKRCEWRGISTKVIHHELGDKLPEKIDIIYSCFHDYLYNAGRRSFHTGIF